MKLTRSALALVVAATLGVAMHAKENPRIPDYSQTPRAQVPEEFKWRVADLFANDQAWRTEFEAVKKLAGSLEPMAKGWTDSSKAMADFVERASEIQRRGAALYAYSSHQADQDLAEPRFQTMNGELQSFFVELGSKLTFMEPDILKMGQEKVDAYVKAEPRLLPYHVGFTRTLRMKSHILPEGEERVSAMTGLFSGAAGKASGMLNNLDIPRPEVTLADGAKVLLNTANYQKYRASKNPEDRRKVMQSYWENQGKFQNTFASLMDASVKKDFFNAKIHGFPTCLDASLYPSAIDTAVYKNLVQTVRANLAPLHRYLKLRQRMLKLPTFRYEDVYASAVASVDKHYTFDENRNLVMGAMKPMGAEYGKALNEAFEQRWMDIYPNQGKRSGAYSNGVYGVHPFVLLNYDGSYNSVSTTAHELGHAMHSYFSSKSQPFALADYPIFLAEIASTFNENMLMQHLLKAEKDAQFKLYVLDSYLEQVRGTIFRQTLFADFELAMHERAEQGQSLTPDWLNAKYLELTRLYYGHDQGVVKVDDYIKSEWSGIPHFFNGFYVYQYATGMVASMALSDAVLKEGEPARARYMNQFLKAGDTKFPLETLKSAGVDLSSPRPVEAALKAFDRLVGEMETLYATLEKK